MDVTFIFRWVSGTALNQFQRNGLSTIVTFPLWFCIITLEYRHSFPHSLYHLHHKFAINSY